MSGQFKVLCPWLSLSPELEHYLSRILTGTIGEYLHSDIVTAIFFLLFLATGFNSKDNDLVRCPEFLFRPQYVLVVLSR
jgi:hypothetical protein